MMGFGKYIAAASAGSLALATAAMAQDATGGWSVAQIQQAITGMDINGGPLNVVSGVTNQNIPFLLATLPNTNVAMIIGGIGCPPSDPMQRCQGVSIFYAGQHTVDGVYLNEFNGMQPYAKAFVREQGIVVVSTAEVVKGVSGAAAMQDRVYAFHSGLINFFNNMSQAIADAGGGEKSVANLGQSKDEPAATAASLGKDAPKFMLVDEGRSAGDATIHAIVDELARQNLQ